MLKNILALFVVIAAPASVLVAQQNKPAPIPSVTLLGDAAVGFGKGMVAAPVSIQYHWNLGKKHRFIIGTGLRVTGIFGTDLDFTSAPSSLAGEASSEDTLFLGRPNAFAANIILHLGYYITPKLDAGFSIDAIGFTAGKEIDGVFTSKGVGRLTSAKPTSFNLLLVGNNDKGSLNSEFYVRYRVGKRMGVRAAYQYLFTEYTTATNVQQTPEANDRFRNKSGLAQVGLSFYF